MGKTPEERDVIEAFVAALNAVPSVRAELRRGLREGASGGPDAVVEVEALATPLLLFVEVKQTAFPRDVREALWRLRNEIAHGAESQSAQLVPFIVAQALSPGARTQLRDEGVGYYDTGGSLYLPARGAYVFVDRPPPKAKARALSGVFQGRRASVLRALFAKRDHWVNVKEISEAADVSPATASETFSELERRDWVETRGSGPAKERRLSDPRAMLDAWTQDISMRPAPRLRRYWVAQASPLEIVRLLASSCAYEGAPYEITGEAAAQAYDPHLTQLNQVRCRMRLDKKGEVALAGLHPRQVSEGWNLAVIETKDRSDFSDAQTIDGVTFASPLQTYLDLLQASGRGKELAAHIRETRLEA